MVPAGFCTIFTVTIQIRSAILIGAVAYADGKKVML